MTVRTLLALLAFLALVAGAAAFGTRFTPGAWHAALVKPAWNPPNWVFGPVWSVLYVMIAVAGWLVWQRVGGGWLLGLWAAQLLLNAAWSWIMFGQHQIGWALVDIGVLLAAIVIFTVAAWRVEPKASLLFLPYVAWVGFATALNFALWRLNG